MKNIEAWNILGDILWNKGDLDMAFICFDKANKQKENKYSYQELSILVRQFQKKSPIDLCNESLDYINKAIKLDPDDGYSYCIFIL